MKVAWITSHDTCSSSFLDKIQVSVWRDNVHRYFAPPTRYMSELTVKQRLLAWLFEPQSYCTNLLLVNSVYSIYSMADHFHELFRHILDAIDSARCKELKELRSLTHNKYNVLKPSREWPMSVFITEHF